MAVVEDDPVTREALCDLLSTSVGFACAGAWGSVEGALAGLPESGAEVLALYPIPPVADGMALCHGITSLYDQFILGVVGDRQVMPDMHVYIECLRQSTEEYLALVRPIAEPSVTGARPSMSRKRTAASAAPASTPDTEPSST